MASHWWYYEGYFVLSWSNYDITDGLSVRCAAAMLLLHHHNQDQVSVSKDFTSRVKRQVKKEQSVTSG